jgi:hypothetical protein
MSSGTILTVLSFVATVQSECQIHHQELMYYNISDLGVAALHNDVDAVDDLIIKVGSSYFEFTLF